MEFKDIDLEEAREHGAVEIFQYFVQEGRLYGGCPNEEYWERFEDCTNCPLCNIRWAEEITVDGGKTVNVIPETSFGVCWLKVSDKKRGEWLENLTNT